MIRSSAAFIITFCFVTAACSKSRPVSPVANGEAVDLFSDRPIASVPDLFVVTLNSPALLAAARATPGGIEIPEDAKKAVLAEQTAFEQKLKAVAPDAQIVYRYRLTLNGLAVFAQSELAAVLMGLAGVRAVTPAAQLARPTAVRIEPAPALSTGTNSVNFIGGGRARELGHTGKGIRVGVLDTGVDYTHAMLGGAGAREDFKGIDPDQPSALFPNAKVVGGVDLVGTAFNAASSNPSDRLPKPDANPIDEAGHGTHVAGTVAGIGDGQSSYSGVAPDAEIFAVKVFGKGGATADAVVIAGFEYAADPNGDLNPNDRLDVINLSLGGGFGQPQILYNEAARNLVRAGTFVVASAGNSGPTDYIVGAPSTADEALSVAASVDGSAHNWQFEAVRFTRFGGEHFAVKAIEGPISKSIREISAAEGPLVHIGLAAQDLTDEQKAELKGKVALIDRGQVPFADKLRRAVEAGAIGAVVINNEPGNAAFAMGGNGKVDIPAVMIGLDTGTRLLADMKLGEVRVEFKTPDRIFEPELIDTITDFSSKGPRSEDNLLKPEIAAPGEAIVSAQMGGGTAAVRMSGTSMAAPHMAGVIAVLRATRPELKPHDLKALVMGTSKVLRGAGGPLPLTLQGAGRVQLDRALEAKLLVTPAALSLGRVQVGSSRRLTREITVTNISAQPLNVRLLTESSPGMSLSVPPTLSLEPGASATLLAEIAVSMSGQEFVTELGGRIQFITDQQILAQIPALAIATQAALIKAQSPGATGVTMVNSSPLNGLALPFNLIGEDSRKVATSPADRWKSRSCDLQSAGYRIIKKSNSEGQLVDYLQIAFKLYAPVTTWILCEVSALVDADGDGVAEQEFAGSHGANLAGSGQGSFVSLLLDAPKARKIRMNYEAGLAAGRPTPLDYSSSILEVSRMLPFPQSTLAVIEAPLARVAKSPDGKIHLRLATLGGGGDIVEADDYLGVNPLGDWVKVPADTAEQAFINLPEFVEVPGREQARANFQRGTGSEKLVIYYPNNEFLMNGHENQSEAP